MPTVKNVYRLAWCLLTGFMFASTPSSVQAQCPYLGSFAQSSDNLTNNASPYVYLLGSNPGIAYEDHGTGNLAVDSAPPGGRRTVTNIGINHTTYGLGDVTAAVVGGTVWIDFLAANNELEIVGTNDGINFGTPSVIGISNMNLGFTPALASYYGELFAAFVSSSSNQSVYLAELEGGGWVILGEVSSIKAISRPSLAVFGNNLYIAYTTTSGYPVAGQVETNNTFSVNVTQQDSVGAFGYKDAHGVWAGVALVPYSGALYMIGQSTSSSQYLYGAKSTNGVSYGTAVECSPNTQLRWTPSAIELPNGNPFIAFQGAGNTNIYANSP